MGKIKEFLYFYSTPLVVYITPLVLLPLPLLVEGKEALSAYVLLLMGTYWCTEVIPLGVTALIPIFLLPMFNIMDTKTVCQSYMENTTMIMMGGLVMAIGVEKSNLHRRISISVLKMIGSSPRWLMLGFMLPTWFLSMWISNTATTAMMMPIVQEVIQKLQDIRKTSALARKHSSLKDAEANGNLKGPALITNGDVGPHPPASAAASYIEMDTIADSQTVLVKDDISSSYTLHAENVKKEAEGDSEEGIDAKFKELSKALTICVAYAANAGGTGTIIGTPVNLVLKGRADELWAANGQGESPINFTSWMVLGFPISLINLLIIWVWLEVFYIGPKDFCGCCAQPESKEEQDMVMEIIKKEHRKLGKLKVEEIQVLILFGALVLLWFFRAPGFMAGWGEFWDSGVISDAVPAIMMAVVLFTIPAVYPLSNLKEKTPDTLVTWKALKDNFPWDVMLLLGGGFALAEGTKESGLSEWLGEKMSGLSSLPDALLLIILGLFCTALTQFTSNLATASIMLPIVETMAESINKNPLYLMLPVVISVQYAFMLPVATPPNAVAFSSGRLKVIDMIKAGTILNVLCVLTMALAMNTWLVPYFNLDTIPWDESFNDTLSGTTLAPCVC